MVQPSQVTLEKLVSLCKRRGFAYQSAEIYGGLNGVYDTGPLGVLLKNNIRAAWARSLKQLGKSVLFFRRSHLRTRGHVAGIRPYH